MVGRHRIQEGKQDIIGEGKGHFSIRTIPNFVRFLVLSLIVHGVCGQVFGFLEIFLGLTGVYFENRAIRNSPLLLAEQLTLSQPGGQIIATITTFLPPWIFRPSDSLVIRDYSWRLNSSIGIFVFFFQHLMKGIAKNYECI